MEFTSVNWNLTAFYDLQDKMGVNDVNQSDYNTADHGNINIFRVVLNRTFGVFPGFYRLFVVLGLLVCVINKRFVT
jgi:hypothetical protein